MDGEKKGMSEKKKLTSTDLFIHRLQKSIKDEIFLFFLLSFLRDK